MKLHILNGDCLQDILQAENAIIVREMFVEGPIISDSFDALLRARSTYLEKTYSIPFDEYQRKFVSEFEKIKYIPNHTEVFLWFDYDLFCFVNLLFILQILNKNKTLKLSLVRPLRKGQFKIWQGFGNHTISDLMLAFSQKTPLKKRDLDELLHIWNMLGKRSIIKYHRLIPFLQKHLEDYQLFSKAKKIEASWGFTEGQIKRIIS
jgi:hypothetical protein